MWGYPARLSISDLQDRRDGPIGDFGDVEVETREGALRTIRSRSTRVNVFEERFSILLMQCGRLAHQNHTR